MKKACIGFFCCLIFLAGCSGGGDTAKLDELEERVSELEDSFDKMNDESKDDKSKDKDSKKDSDSGQSLDAGETITLSGVIVIGVDLEPGAYDISTAKGEDDFAFSLYENEEARTADNYKFEWESDPLKSYNLREGNILDLRRNTNFTRVR